MTISAREFLLRMEDKGHPGAPTCCRCGGTLHESVTGNRFTGQGYMDSDCYFEALGELVESSPVRTARIRRG